ncbi:hypothetical protein [Dyadobacter sp. CY326]|uniref:hypothetical protein n=1 Tax=Dyadobacter sp. CY326 TaxID=2907300 RepID=UPI001F30141F|nr:hypothetical protein [Dyadobacter sp. CY326]MCE7065096.1 hypothetical protein [Dyadobacter sp. CY326]
MKAYAMKIMVKIILAILIFTGKLYAQTLTRDSQKEVKSVKIDTVITMDKAGRKHIRITDENGNRILITTTLSGDTLTRRNIVSVHQTSSGNSIEVIQNGHGNSISVSQQATKRDD